MAASAIFTFYAQAQAPDGKVHVWFLDVGQGDAIFIETPSGQQILVDGGPDNSVVQELGKVMPFWDKTIDLVVMTHPDADHLNGLPEVLKRYEVESVLETGVECSTSQCESWRGLIKEKGIEKYIAKFGQTIDMGDGVQLFVFNPIESKEGESVSKKNNTSVVIKVVYGEQSLLLTGDIEGRVESKLVLAGLDINSDFLKIAHHGSKTSSTREFLDAVSPAIAFISAGTKNRYGHPTQEVLNRLENDDIKYYRTDLSGTIELTLDNNNYSINFIK